MKLSELAIKINSTIIGNVDIDILGVSPIESIESGHLAVAYDRKNLDTALSSDASAVLIGDKLFEEAKDVLSSLKKSFLVANDAKRSFLAAIKIFDWHRLPDYGIAETAVISKNAEIGENVFIGDYVYIGENTKISDNVKIYPNAYIGDFVEIGDSSIIYPNVTIYSRLTIGERVIIQSGAVIGADGHGFNPTSIGSWERIPHIGTVIIEDDVEVGAGSTIDRATLGATVIGSGSKLDNLVMIAHNVQIGKNCMIVAQVGIAGSSIVEDNVVLGGQVGVADHVSIGSGAFVAAQSGITKRVAPGSMVSGSPFQPHKEQLREQALVRKLPEMAATVKDLKREIEELKKK